MGRQKRIFVIFAVAFLAGLVMLSYDISKRTTFPGSRPQLNEQVKTNSVDADSAISEDSTKIKSKMLGNE
jgi:hypothetical protein